MSNILEVKIEGFYDECNNFKKRFNDYQKNVQKQPDIYPSYVAFDIYAEEPKEILKGLIKVIHSAVIIYDTCSGIKFLDKEHKQFMSGVKAIDNFIKHEEKSIDINKLINISPEITSLDEWELRTKGISAENANVTLSNRWLAISKNEFNTKYVNQIKVYNKNVVGLSALESVNMLKKIIDMLID